MMDAQHQTIPKSLRMKPCHHSIQLHDDGDYDFGYYGDGWDNNNDDVDDYNNNDVDDGDGFEVNQLQMESIKIRGGKVAGSQRKEGSKNNPLLPPLPSLMEFFSRSKSS